MHATTRLNVTSTASALQTWYSSSRLPAVVDYVSTFAGKVAIPVPEQIDATPVLTVDVTDARFFILSWLAPPSSDATSYTVACNASESNESRVIGTTSLQNLRFSAIASDLGLTKAGTVDFHVIPVNRGGSGPPVTLTVHYSNAAPVLTAAASEIPAVAETFFAPVSFQNPNGSLASPGSPAYNYSGTADLFLIQLTTDPTDTHFQPTKFVTAFYVKAADGTTCAEYAYATKVSTDISSDDFGILQIKSTFTINTTRLPYGTYGTKEYATIYSSDDIGFLTRQDPVDPFELWVAM